MTLFDLDLSSAACAGAEPTLFHHPSKAEFAKRVCGGCPIIDACRETALQLEKCWGIAQRSGVFGGMTPAERYAEDRRRWPDEKVRKKTDPELRKALAS